MRYSGMRVIFSARRAKVALASLACASVTALALIAPAPGAGAAGAVSVPRAYATALFARVPIPPGARRLSTPLASIGPLGAMISTDDVHLVRYYLVPSTFGVAHFAQSHFPHSEWGGSGTVDGTYSSFGFSAMSLCANPHAAYCGVSYSFEQLSGARQELRVDVQVVWKPLNRVSIPAGVVTLTGFHTLSLMNASSGPVTVTLTSAQVATLRADIAALRAFPGGMCMEDSLLYKLAVTSSSGKVIWSASADECPGALIVTSGHTHVSLNDRACGLDSFVSSLLPADKAQGSRSGLKVCTSAF